MRVPLSWLQEFTDCRLPPDEIAGRLTLGGLEVEAIERVGIFSREVIAARIERVADLAGSDLRAVELDLGGRGSARAVTGAPNVRQDSVGARVAAALPGAVLVDPREDTFELLPVAARVIRGVHSTAVLSSEKELGLGPDHSGVLFLEEGAEPGRPALDACQPGPEAEADIALEVAILPNYGRCLSVIGMARELAALTRCSFRVELDAEYVQVDPRAFPVEIQDPDLCRRYSGYVLRGLEVRPSPRWLARRLVLSGLKPINNVVDVTNYVMLELGQPMHAFDLRRLGAPRIEVRRARPGETIATLDQKPLEDGTPPPPRPLEDSTLLITSGDRPVAVAGVIGGLESQIEADTRDILLESANFDPVSIRRTMSFLRITTDSALRFSRHVDPALTVLAIQRATYLLGRTAGARPAGAIADSFPRPLEPRTVPAARRDICRTLGMELTGDQVSGSLERLGFAVHRKDEAGEELEVEVPGFRADVSLPADLAEEVIRVVGFDRLPSRELREPLPRPRRNRRWELKQSIRDFLVAADLQDVITYSLTTRAAESRLRLSRPGAGEELPPYVDILNPSSQERSSLRRTLLDGLLDCVARNHRQRARIALFEIGPVFLPEGGAGSLPREPEHLGIVLSGPVKEPSWRDPEVRQFSFFDLKGIVGALLEKLHIEGYRLERCISESFHPGAAAALFVAGRPAGAMGQIHPEVAEHYELGGRAVVACELDLEPWFEAAVTQHAYRPFSRHPPLRQDLALVVAEEVPAAEVMRVIREAAGPLLTGIRLFDLYRGKQLGEGKKGLAFELTFSAEDRSLKEEEVNALRDAILGPLAERLGARIRT